MLVRCATWITSCGLLKNDHTLAKAGITSVFASYDRWVVTPRLDFESLEDDRRSALVFSNEKPHAMVWVLCVFFNQYVWFRTVDYNCKAFDSTCNAWGMLGVRACVLSGQGNWHSPGTTMSFWWAYLIGSSYKLSRFVPVKENHNSQPQCIHTRRTAAS